MQPNGLNSNVTKLPADQLNHLYLIILPIVLCNLDSINYYYYIIINNNSPTSLPSLLSLRDVTAAYLIHDRGFV